MDASLVGGLAAQMTWRAFILGLLAVIGVALLDPYTSFNRNYGWNTQGHLPVAAVFLLVVFAVGLNVVVKLVRRRWALKHAELMLIWCMLIVGCAVPSNLMRFWFPVLAAPPYLARRPDITWKDTALELAPDSLLLTKDPRSPAVEQFFEGWRGGEGRVPWRHWLRPISRWAVLLAFFYLATFFMCGLLRRQWVDRERLQFPLARVPLEFTQEGPGRSLLPALFSNGAFLGGLITAAAIRLLRAAPLLTGAETGWNLAIPLQTVLRDTPLEQMQFVNFDLNWIPIGLAYLVPADVSLSVWFFYLFGRFELQTAAWLGSPLHYGGSGSEWMLWHRPGAYVAFTVGALFMGRRHIADVLRKALGLRGGLDDSAEPVGYRLGFWGFLLCVGGVVWWFVHYGMGIGAATAFLLLLLCTQFVHARVVSQSGIYRTAPLSRGPALLQALSFGHLFSPTGAVVANMQYTVMINGNNSMLGPAAIHAFRISEVFEKRRRLLLPALVTALAVAIAASSWTCLHQAYSERALTFSNVWAVIANPKSSFDMAHLMIRRSTDIATLRLVPFGLGAALTGIVMFMRARFFWWPIHPIGLLVFADYGVDRMWFSFLLGWLIKVLFLKFGSGRLLRQGRYFFIGFIVSQFFVDGAWSLVSFLTRGGLPGAGVWI